MRQHHSRQAMAPPEKGIHPKLHERFYNSLSEKQWSDRFDQPGLKAETIRKTFVSYSALIDFYFRTEPSYHRHSNVSHSRWIDRWVHDDAVLHAAPSQASAAVEEISLNGSRATYKPD